MKVLSLLDRQYADHHLTEECQGRWHHSVRRAMYSFGHPIPPRMLDCELVRCDGCGGTFFAKGFERRVGEAEYRRLLGCGALTVPEADWMRRWKGVTVADFVAGMGTSAAEWLEARKSGGPWVAGHRVRTALGETALQCATCSRQVAKLWSGMCLWCFRSLR